MSCCGNTSQKSKYATQNPQARKPAAKVIQMDVSQIMAQSNMNKAIQQNAAASRQYTSHVQRKTVYR